MQQPELSERLLAGDEPVLEEILRAFGPCIQAVLCRRYRGVLRTADVEDVLAIGLFRLWTNRHRYDARRGSLRVWFFRITDNAARDVLRHGWHRARMKEVGTEPGWLAELPEIRHETQRTTQPVDEPSALQTALREVIARLPDAQRRILLADAACRDGTASSRWLSEELDLPPSTIRVYRKRALDRVRAELRQRGFEVP